MLLPQPELDFNLFGYGGHIFPRTDGVIIGGTFDERDWNLEPDPAISARILERNTRLVARLRAPETA